MTVKLAFACRSHRHRRRQLRTGLTLLETLLALALTTLLMVTIVASTTLYAQYRFRGIEGARHAQVLWGTFSDLQNDLQACYGAAHDELPQLTAAQGQEAASQETASFSTNSNMAQERVLAFSTSQPQPVRFIGRENAILLLHQGTNPRFAWNEFHPTTDESHVLWLAPQTRAIRLPYALEERREVEREFALPGELAGKVPALWRGVMPVVDPRISRESWPGYQASLGTSWDKNPAIHQLQFRYFDGDSWRREWDSHRQENRLPLAVEVQLTFVSSPKPPMRLVLGMPQ